MQPAKLLQPGYAGDARLDDFDAVGSLSPVWEEQYTQIGKGRPDIRVSFTTTSRMQLALVSRGPGVRIRGASRGGTAILAIPLDHPRMHIHGEPVESERFVYFAPGREYEVLSPARHEILALAVDASLLDEAMRARWGFAVPPGLPGTFLQVKREAQRSAAIRSWTTWLSRSVANPAALADPAVAGRMEEEVLGSFLDAVSCAEAPRPARARRELALRAEAWIRETLGEPTRLDDMCAAMRTSARTLHASFQSVFGFPPKAYQRALRMSAVRRELLHARPGTTVSEVAARWGFLQFGAFAVDYRRMFGERPSETLGRGRGTPARREPQADHRLRAS